MVRVAPRISGSPADRVASYRAKCQACHDPQDRKRGPDCVSCHMPKSQAIDAGHGAFTDHSIARRPFGSARARPLAICPARSSAADAGDRELAFAYAQLYDQRTRDERQKLRKPSG